MFKYGVENTYPSFGFCSSYKPSKNQQQRLASCSHRNSQRPNKLFTDGETSILYPDKKGQIENGPVLYKGYMGFIYVTIFTTSALKAALI